MNKKDVVALLKSVSVKELQSLIALKQKLDTLEKNRGALEKELMAVNGQIRSIQVSHSKSGVRGRPAGKKKAVKRVLESKIGAKKKAMKKAGGKKPRKRVKQLSISTLIVDILKEKKKPISVNKICDALLTEKQYKTQSEKFGNQIRVLLYRNEKGLFKKTGPGLFRLA